MRFEAFGSERGASHRKLAEVRNTLQSTAEFLLSGRASPHNADGFNVMPPSFHEGFEDFVQLVVPILQERGLFRVDYEGATLRDHLGLRRPKNALF